MTLRQLLIASGNEGKIREFGSILSAIPMDIVSLRQFPDARPVEETGSTFAENALLKAQGYARQTGILSLADDSGLEVEALGNRPGVLSARYGGADNGFPEKMARILQELNTTKDAARRARFVCVIALADADGSILFSAEGVCRGTIAAEPRGTRGFGYDPIFIPEGFSATFGELDEDISSKSAIARRLLQK